MAEALALGPPAADFPPSADCQAALGYNDWDALDMDAAIVQLTAGPPFLDQLDHAARQARAASDVAERTRRFDPAAMRRAAATARAAVEKNPGDWQLRFILGRTLLAFGQPAEAAPHLEAAVRAVPGYGLPRQLLTQAQAAH